MKRAKRCTVCMMPYRGKGSMVMVARDGALVRARACPSCVAGAVPLVVRSPRADARLCHVCKVRQAVACESCVTATRINAAKQGRAAGLAERLGPQLTLTDDDAAAFLRTLTDRQLWALRVALNAAPVRPPKSEDPS